MAGKESKVSKRSLDNLRPAKKGEPSRNPSGISKERAQFKSLFEKAMLEDAGGKDKGLTVLEACLAKLVRAALIKEKRWAIEFVCERAAPKTLDLGIGLKDGVEFRVVVVKGNGS